jgi:hypothetical protein
MLRAVLLADVNESAYTAESAVLQAFPVASPWLVNTDSMAKLNIQKSD